MTKQTEALRLALEALENAQANVGEWWPEAITAIEEALAEQSAQQQGWKLVPMEPTEAMLDAWQTYWDAGAHETMCYAELLDAAPQPNAGFPASEPAAQQQELVAKICPDLPGGIGWNPNLTQLPDEGSELYTSPQPAQQQEPVAIEPNVAQLQQLIGGLSHCYTFNSKAEFLSVWIRDWTKHKLSKHTSPPAQRTWVGLTDEDIRPMCKHDWVFETLKQWAQIIEAKLREKNT